MERDVDCWDWVFLDEGRSDSQDVGSFITEVYVVWGNISATLCVVVVGDIVWGSYIYERFVLIVLCDWIYIFKVNNKDLFGREHEIGNNQRNTQKSYFASELYCENIRRKTARWAIA